MRILIAPDKFKGSLTAPEACDAIAAGILDARPDATIDCCPMSDGGEGFVEAMTRARNGRVVARRVTGPLPERQVEASLAIVDGDRPGDTAVIEMASASGLALLAPADRNPLYTTTFGTGELVRFAAEMECRQVLLGIGGSATCDAGVGALQACGCHVILSSQQYASITEPLCGRDLDDVVMIKAHRGSRVDGIRITIACDVTNPLFGPDGAAIVYGPQKGASASDVRELDRMLTSLSARLGWNEIAARPGSGAAGGIGCGLAAMFGATLTPGVEMVMAATRLRERMMSADLIITGEGRLDETSASGKVVGGVAHLAAELGKSCIAIAGQIDDAAHLSALGLKRWVSLVDVETPAPQAIANAGALLRQRAAKMMATA
jgi:glycerate kinase